jgi:hypothetical protein
MWPSTCPEITSRLTVRAYAAILDAQLGPQVRELLMRELLFIFG